MLYFLRHCECPRVSRVTGIVSVAATVAEIDAVRGDADMLGFSDFILSEITQVTSAAGDETTM